MDPTSSNSGSARRLTAIRHTIMDGYTQRNTVQTNKIKIPSKKDEAYFANMFSPIGATGVESPSVSPRDSVTNLTTFCTFVLSEKKETIRRIVSTYTEVAQLTCDNTLTLKEKMSRIATYLAALIVILNKKVCHGDLKPENILWDEEHFVISDFNGSILIEEICKQMNPQFRIESDEYREKLSNVVTAFCKNSPHLEKVCSKNKPQFTRLVNWKLVNKERNIIDKDKLESLNSYLRTKYFPDHSKGYASMLYLKKMADYFWQCDAINFENAANAFDIRAAGLTICIILTGARPPLKEDDTAYYTTLESSLKELGINPRAIALLRRMAEPIVKNFGKNFSMPVTMDELEELETIFANRPVVLPPTIENSPTISPRQSSISKSNAQANLAMVQDALERLSIIEGEEEDITKQNAMKNLIDALTPNDIKHLGAKLPPNEKITSITRKAVIKYAFEQFPYSSELNYAINGHPYTVLLLVDQNNLHKCDVLLKKEVVGDGASAVAFKALSLRSLRHVVVRYSQELADSSDVKNAQKVASRMGPHDGLQSVTEPFDVTTKAGTTKVVIDAFYKKRDYGAAVHGEILCRRLAIAQQDWGDCEKVKAALNEVNKDLMEVLFSDTATESKQLKLNSFIDNYGHSIFAIIGMHKGKQLLEDYNSLITESTAPAVKEPLKVATEGKKSPRKFSLFPSLGSPKSPRSLRMASSQPTSRRSSITSETDLHSWQERELNEQANPTATKDPIPAINVKALEILINDPNHAQERGMLIQNATKITLKAIRDCQRLILQDYLMEHVDPKANQDPRDLLIKWQKEAVNHNENHLDLAGLNEISRIVDIPAIPEDTGKGLQRTLAQLLAIKTEVWKLKDQGFVVVK